MGAFPVNCRLYSVVVTDNQPVKKRNLTIISHLSHRLSACGDTENDVSRARRDCQCVTSAKIPL